jgi:hypothetical protein
MEQKFNIDEIVKHKTLKGNYIIKATRKIPYDGRGSSPFNELIKVKDNYDYRICEVKADNSFAKFIDAKESELYID